MKSWIFFYYSVSNNPFLFFSDAYVVSVWASGGLFSWPLCHSDVCLSFFIWFIILCHIRSTKLSVNCLAPTLDSTWILIHLREELHFKNRVWKLCVLIAKDMSLFLIPFSGEKKKGKMCVGVVCVGVYLDIPISMYFPLFLYIFFYHILPLSITFSIFFAGGWFDIIPHITEELFIYLHLSLCLY